MFAALMRRATCICIPSTSSMLVIFVIGGELPVICIAFFAKQMQKMFKGTCEETNPIEGPHGIRRSSESCSFYQVISGLATSRMDLQVISYVEFISSFCFPCPLIGLISCRA
jgi:hypothetical protein